jgi:hypothetical protein
MRSSACSKQLNAPCFLRRLVPFLESDVILN